MLAARGTESRVWARDRKRALLEAYLSACRAQSESPSRQRTMGGFFGAPLGHTRHRHGSLVFPPVSEISFLLGF